MSTNNPNPRPTRRNFLLAAPVAAAGAVALAGTRPAAAAGRRRPDLEPHNEYNASLDVCCCRECLDVRMARGAHPLHHAAVLAARRAELALAVLCWNHVPSCDDACRPSEGGCYVCHAARLAHYHMGHYAAALECEHSPDPATGRACHLILEQLHGGAGLPRPRASRHGNAPGHEQAVVALLDLRDAADAMAEGHPDEELAGEAEGVAGGVEHWLDLLSGCMRATSQVDARL